MEYMYVYMYAYVRKYVVYVCMYGMGEPAGREGKGRGGEDGRARVLRHFKGEMAPSPPRTPPSAAGPPRFPGTEGRRGARE